MSQWLVTGLLEAELQLCASRHAIRSSPEGPVGEQEQSK
jgi:hypothetical protein